MYSQGPMYQHMWFVTNCDILGRGPNDFSCYIDFMLCNFIIVFIQSMLLGRYEISICEFHMVFEA